MRSLSGRSIAVFLALLWPLAAGAALSGQMLAASSGAVVLGDKPTHVTLAPTPGAGPLRQQLAALGLGRRLFLVLDDLRVTAPPGVVYEVYLGLPAGANPGPGNPHLVGTLNFFAVAPPNAAPQRRSYDVTAQLGTLLSQRSSDEPTTVTIAPATGSPAATAAPEIGQIALVAE